MITDSVVYLLIITVDIVPTPTGFQVTRLGQPWGMSLTTMPTTVASKVVFENPWTPKIYVLERTDSVSGIWGGTRFTPAGQFSQYVFLGRNGRPDVMALDDGVVVRFGEQLDVVLDNGNRYSCSHLKTKIIFASGSGTRLKPSSLWAVSENLNVWWYSASEVATALPLLCAE